MTKTDFSRQPREYPHVTLTNGSPGPWSGHPNANDRLRGRPRGSSCNDGNANAPLPAKPVVESGFAVRNTVDWAATSSNLRQRRHVRHPGQHPVWTARAGSNLTLRAVPGTKHPLLD